MLSSSTSAKHLENHALLMGVSFWAASADSLRPSRRCRAAFANFSLRAWTAAEATDQAPLSGHWWPLEGIVRHTFTHFHLELMVLAADVKGRAPKGALWCPPARFSDHALPTVMKKVARHAERGTVIGPSAAGQ
mgnify:CR=1 FL=1